MPRSLPGFCDSASLSPPFVSPLSFFSPFAFSSLPAPISLSPPLSTLCCRHFPFASWLCKFASSSLHLQVFVPLRPRGCAQEEEEDGLYAYLIISTLILGRHLTARIVCASFSSLFIPFSLLLFIYPSCFPWFKGCR